MFIALSLQAAPLADVPPAPAIRVSERPQRTVQLGAAAMFRLAAAALAKGQPKTAEAIYSVMEQDPNADVRAEARYRRAQLYLGGGRKRDAAVLLRRILDDKPDAVRVRLDLAKILAGLGEPEAALRELRAAQSSGLPPAVARLVDRYSEALRATRSTGGSFEIAIAPDSNINRATRLDNLGTVIGDFEIDEDSKAKSGTGLALRGQAYRRFGLGTDANFLLRLSGSSDLYRDTRFNDIAIDLAAGPEIRAGRNRLNVELGATQRWYGQKPFVRSVQLGVTAARPLGSLAQLRLSTSASLVDNRFNDLQDGRRYAGRLALERALSPTTGIGLNLSLSRDALKDPAYSTTGWNAALTGWREMGRMTFTLQAQIGRLHADEALALFPERRSDRFSSLSVGATLRQLQFRGFAPLLRLSVERNSSTIAFYDYSRTRTEIGIVRAF
jgi:tetratricopeptide (TPR) repeat protein